MFQLRPPRRVAACPECGGKVALNVRSRTRRDWRCRDLLCSASGNVLADGYLAVRERFVVLHRPLVTLRAA